MKVTQSLILPLPRRPRASPGMSPARTGLRTVSRGNGMGGKEGGSKRAWGLMRLASLSEGRPCRGESTKKRRAHGCWVFKVKNECSPKGLALSGAAPGWPENPSMLEAVCKPEMAICWGQRLPREEPCTPRQKPIRPTLHVWPGTVEASTELMVSEGACMSQARGSAEAGHSA